MKYASKFAKFFTVAALAGAFLFFSPTNANAQRGFRGRGFYGHPGPRVVVGAGFYGGAPYYAPGYVAPYYAPAPVVVAPSVGFGFGYRPGFYGREGFYGRDRVVVGRGRDFRGRR
jgi:hypothetical protein